MICKLLILLTCLYLRVSFVSVVVVVIVNNCELSFPPFCSSFPIPHPALFCRPEFLHNGPPHSDPAIFHAIDPAFSGLPFSKNWSSRSFSTHPHTPFPSVIRFSRISSRGSRDLFPRQEKCLPNSSPVFPFLHFRRYPFPPSQRELFCNYRHRFISSGYVKIASNWMVGWCLDVQVA